MSSGLAVHANSSSTNGASLTGAAARAGHSQFSGGQRGEFGELHCKLGHAVRSNPFSSPSLPKTGIFQVSARDYLLFRSGTDQIRSLETNRQFEKASHWRAFLALPRVKSPSVGLPGWRRSGDRTRLHANSLLTGNFTGNFAISGLPRPIS
jgi:hypothetical protein